MCERCSGQKMVKVAGEDGKPDYRPCPACVRCIKCEDSGRIIVWDAEGNRRAVTCECVEAGRVDRYLEAARIPSMYAHVDLDNYDLHTCSLSQRKAKFIADRFVKREEEMLSKGLLFSGRCGTGKTHLAVAVLKELVRRERRPGRFCDARALMDDILRSYDRDDETEYDLINPVLKAPLLVLDDLGAGKISEYTQEKLASILTQRYNDKLTTIITTNYAVVPPRLAAQRTDARGHANLNGEGKTLGDCIGERAYSRLAEMCLSVKIEGGDFRDQVKRVSELHL